jgi:hypothetical protein
VSEEAVEWFNFETVQQYFESIGVTYTPADKGDRSYRSEVIGNATIGKRTWVYDDREKLWKAPLERPSILKSLTIRLKSKMLTPSAQQRAALDSAWIEFAQYGPEHYACAADALKPVFPDIPAPEYGVLIDRQRNYGFTPWLPDQEELAPLEVIPLGGETNPPGWTWKQIVGGAAFAAAVAMAWKGPPPTNPIEGAKRTGKVAAIDDVNFGKLYVSEMLLNEHPTEFIRTMFDQAGYPYGVTDSILRGFGRKKRRVVVKIPYELADGLIMVLMDKWRLSRDASDEDIQRIADTIEGYSRMSLKPNRDVEADHAPRHRTPNREAKRPRRNSWAPS